MEHNLEDTLNLESAIGGIDFENSSDVVVSQADITLDTVTHDEDIPMEFEHIEEQPLLMDTESEEIIDFMSDQFSLQEYSVQDDQTTTTTTTEESNQNVLTSQSDTVIDLQFDALTSMPVKQDSNLQPKYIAIKAAPDRVGAKKSETVAGGPRQIAIAPKLPKLVPMGARQYTLAPKPVALITNTSSGLKKVPLNAAPKGNAVLAQIGKQLVVMPPGSPKIKLVTSGSTNASNIQYIKTNSSQQAQLVTSKSVQGGKPIMAKVIVQGQYNTDAANQQTVITKLLPTTSCVTPQTRYVMQQKTVPISLGNKVLLASPTKQGMKFAKKQQIIAIKSLTPKLMPAPTQASTTKKVVITANPSQNVILKTTAPPKAGQVSKDGKVVIQNQRSQLHQINVPGKGIQYIRLITNQTSGTSKTLPKTLTAVSGPPKSFVLTDNKGQQKLVRLAPLVSKPSSVTVTTSASRSAQSLLAPLSPMDVNVEASEMIKQEQQVSESSYPQSPVQDEDTNSMEPHESEENLEEQLIVIPSNFGKVEDATDDCSQEEGTKFIENLNFETEVVEHSPSPVMPLAVSDCETSTDLGLRARRACNCTKSQCLKLYCDCFANGEFCNKCNCTNCYNNLDHEELRQKAIRACLERNPNAFRPKIGKSKAGGPEIIRRHNKGCNCKRSGCLKNYCECYEAKIACTAMCKCFGCRNVEESLHRGRRRDVPHPLYRPPPLPDLKQPCSFMTAEVIEAVCQCLIAASVNGGGEGPADPVRDVIDEFSRCLQDIIGASHHAPPEGNT